MKQEIKNCAIYCRKSSEEGLDMDFNSLDAQRESCEAYISSQKAEGWKTVKTQYEDGGFSGGNMERPGLQQLLTDIKDRKIDIVVVYKIDRLTLNVLLSFAQFEREVCAERIRDKFAASKKKGMWMGGVPPVGYEVQDRQLLINEEGEKTVKYLFKQYLELGCVAKLKRKLDEDGIITQKRLSQRGKEMGGKPYSRGALHAMLKNPIYIGKIKHKDKIYEGLHEGVIDDNVWKAVQKKLNAQAVAKEGHKKSRETNLLKGLLFDCEGTPYSPDYTKKKNGQIYRYYTS